MRVNNLTEHEKAEIRRKFRVNFSGPDLEFEDWKVKKDSCSANVQKLNYFQVKSVIKAMKVFQLEIFGFWLFIFYNN